MRLKGTPNAEVNYPIFGKWDVTSPTLFTLHAGDYTASGCGDMSNPRLNLVRLNDGRLVSIHGNRTFTLDKDTNFVAVFVFADANKYVDITFTPMIEKGSTATSYEPYTGGIPSPNPAYPQEIKSVVNPTVKVCGKNLLKATLQTATVNGVTCTNNGDGTYTLNGTASNGGAEFLIAQFSGENGQKLLGCPSNSKCMLQAIDRATWTHVSSESGNGVIIKDSDTLTHIRIFVSAGISVSNETIKPMLTTNLTATYDDFEPYHEQTVTLPYTLNAIPVNSGGNVTIDGQQYVSDYVDVERGKLVRMVEKKVLNGTENWNLSERSENRNGVFQFFADANIAGALCDKAIYESLTSHYGTFDTWYNQIRFYAHTDEMTVEEWRNFLSSNEGFSELTKRAEENSPALLFYLPKSNNLCKYESVCNASGFSLSLTTTSLFVSFSMICLM